MTCQTPISEIYSENYRFLQKHVYSEAGIVLEEDKGYLFETSLSPIVRQLGLGTINELCEFIQINRRIDVGHQVVEAMTTNETLFFRDVYPFEMLRTVVFPDLIKKREVEKRLTVWSAGCSSGSAARSSTRG